MRRIFSTILLLFLFVISGFSQKWVADSIAVDFGDKESTITSIHVVNAFDSRQVFPSFLSIYEENKWLVFPVDQVVKTPRSLQWHFKQKFTNDTIQTDPVVVHIEDFRIKKTAGLGKRNLTLFATLELYKWQRNDSSLLGTFYYEQSRVDKKKLPLKSGYENLLESWSRNFASDVLLVQNDLDEVAGENLYHFRRGKTAVQKNLYSEIEFFGGINFGGFDASLWFSEPEGSRVFNRTTGMMRYINHPDFHAIAFGRNVRLWNYRLNNSWLLQNKIALLMGINNWKDMATADHKLEEILLFDLSFTQRINYNPLDNSSFIFGLGIMEDVHYIIYHQPKVKIGLSLNLAYKF